MKKIWVFITLAVFISLIFILRTITPKPLKDADLYIVEAWISSPTIELMADYIKDNTIDSVYIVGVGNGSASKTFSKPKNIKFPLNLIANGYVSLHFEKDSPGDSILIDLEASAVNHTGAFVLFFANNQLLEQRIVNGREEIFIKTENDIENLYIYFANDTYCKKGEDRNLRLHSVKCGSRPFRIEKQYGGVQVLPNELGITPAIKTQLYFEQLGCNNTCFVAVERNSSKRNKTLQASLLFKEWFSLRPYPKKKLRVNIITTKNHAKRTYLNYKNALKQFAEVGIITLDDKQLDCDYPDAFRRVIGWFEETASIIYTSFYWLYR